MHFALVVDVIGIRFFVHGCFAAATHSRMKKKHSTVITNAIISFSLLGRNQLPLLYTFYKFNEVIEIARV